jgi:phosphonopyruvate decarboxylase
LQPNQRYIFHKLKNVADKGPNQFYNAGGFGITSPIGLGVALAQPSRSVIVIEGDGSVLANVGSLNLIGHYRPDNLIHVVLNNQAYASCPGEPTIGFNLIPGLARECGYRRVCNVTSLEATQKAFAYMLNQHDGPQMLHILINAEGERSFKRPVSMDETADRFREFLIA